MKNKKGFTLVELLITLGLAGIVVSVVMSFFITNIKSYETISTESELQYQSQYIINFMTNKILEANNVKSVNGDSDMSGETLINNIIFEHGTEEFNFEVNDRKLNYIIGLDVSEIGKYIESLIIEPIPEGKFKEANGLKIELILKEGRREYSAKQTVYMRNFK